MYVEYKTLWDTNPVGIEFTALFEIKHKMTQYVKDSMAAKPGTAVWAQIQMCKRLGMRYFMVVSNYGSQPFDFYEFDYSGEYRMKGTLSYDESNKKSQLYAFWKMLGLKNYGV